MVQINVSRSDKVESIQLTDNSKLIVVVCQNYMEQWSIKPNILTVSCLMKYVIKTNIPKLIGVQ